MGKMFRLVIFLVYCALVCALPVDEHSSQQVDPRCPDEHFGLYPVAEDCTAYVACWRGQAGVMKCLPGQRYDSFKYCTKDEADCGQAILGQDTTDVCALPHSTGACKALFWKYYYDAEAKECREFVYGGCDGNENRFDTEEECRRACVRDEEDDGGYWYCSEPGNMSIPTDCRRYLSCSDDNRMSLEDCPDGQYFDEARKTCLPGECDDSASSNNILNVILTNDIQ